MIAYAKNKGVDQPAHPRSLTSTSVVCCLDSMSTKALQRLRKPIHDCICKQQSCRSACASAQSDQHICYLLLRQCEYKGTSASPETSTWHDDQWLLMQTCAYEQFCHCPRCSRYTCSTEIDECSDNKHQSILSIEDLKSELNQEDTAVHKSSDLARKRTWFLQRCRKRNKHRNRALQ